MSRRNAAGNGGRIGRRDFLRLATRGLAVVGVCTLVTVTRDVRLGFASGGVGLLSTSFPTTTTTQPQTSTCPPGP